jgi:Flp pilus assembly protein TadG
MAFSFPSRLRRGATVLEGALVLPIAFLFILGMFIGGLGMFQNHLVAELARIGSRYASVHGSQYAQDAGKPTATVDDIRTALLPSATTMDPSKLTVQASWHTTNDPNVNTVTVTVTYSWRPMLFLTGTYQLSSTSTVQMQY